MPVKIVNADPRYPIPRLIEPTSFGYIYIAGTTRRGAGPVVFPNANRSKLLVDLKEFGRSLEAVEGVIKTMVFRAIVIPPTPRMSTYLKERGSDVVRANFDVMMLVHAKSPAAARDVQSSPPYGVMLAELRKTLANLHVMVARNVRRIGDVDTPDGRGLFLFNHFVAEDPAVMLPLWEHLAGWYVAETGLTNSIAMMPASGEKSDFAIVNWARWDVSPLRHFWTQLAKRSFWRFVPKNLDANRAASMPIYCRLA